MSFIRTAKFVSHGVVFTISKVISIFSFCKDEVDMEIKCYHGHISPVMKADTNQRPALPRQSEHGQVGRGGGGGGVVAPTPSSRFFTYWKRYESRRALMKIASTLIFVIRGCTDCPVIVSAVEISNNAHEHSLNTAYGHSQDTTYEHSLDTTYEHSLDTTYEHSLDTTYEHSLDTTYEHSLDTTSEHSLDTTSEHSLDTTY